MGAAKRIAGKEACEALADFVNDYGADFSGFMAELSRTHRTCQQGIGRLMVRMIAQWAEDYKAGHYDDRNKAICELSRMIQKEIPADNFHLPLI